MKPYGRMKLKPRRKPQRKPRHNKLLRTSKGYLCADCVREGEIRGLLRAARIADSVGKRLRDGYYIIVRDLCRARAASLRKKMR